MTPKLDRILAALRSDLEQLAPMMGDRLPAERTLAPRYACSRETLRQALDQLEQEGLLWRHVGQGTFRGRRPASAPLPEILTLQATSADELVQARLLIEPVVAGEAARRATAQDIQKLQRCVNAGRVGKDRFTCQQADDLFHRTIAEVAQNPILLEFLTFLSRTRQRAAWQTQWDRTYRYFGLEEFTTDHSDHHADVVACIAAQDAQGAEEAMRHHLNCIADALRATPRP